MIADRGPRIDLHSHAGRCFLAGLPAGHSLVAALGAASVPGALRAARAAGMTALVLSAVADFAVLIGCEGGDFLEGDLRRLEPARAVGLTVLTLVHYRVSEIGDVQTEAPVHDGLSRFGRDVVAECNRLGIVIDCAHASLATTMAVLEASSQPVIISHGQLGYAGRRHRPGRELPSGPDRLRPVRRPGLPAARQRPPAGPRRPDPRRQRAGPAEQRHVHPRVLTSSPTRVRARPVVLRDGR